MPSPTTSAEADAVPAAKLEQELRAVVRATVATMLRIRLGSDPTREQVEDALTHWRRFYRIAKETP